MVYLVLVKTVLLNEWLIQSRGRLGKKRKEKKNGENPGQRESTTSKKKRSTHVVVELRILFKYPYESPSIQKHNMSVNDKHNARLKTCYITC